MKKGSIRVTLTEYEIAYLRELLINEDMNSKSIQEVVMDLLEKIQ